MIQRLFKISSILVIFCSILFTTGTLHKGSLQKLKAVILLEMEQLKYLEEKLLERLQKLDSLLKIFSSLAQCGMGMLRACIFISISYGNIE